MFKQFFFLTLLLITVFSSCIKDDFIFDTVDPVLRITSNIDTLAINTSFQFEGMFLNNIGVEKDVEVQWQSSDESIVSISGEGLAQALQVGSVTISASTTNGDIEITDSINLTVGQSTTTVPNEIISGTINTTTFYVLEGDFEYEENEEGTVLSLADNYEASSSLPGLYVYLSNNRNSIANALEIGMVNVFSGEHSYEIPDVGINDYSYIVYFCKPFNVKVGDGEIQ